MKTLRLLLTCCFALSFSACAQHEHYQQMQAPAQNALALATSQITATGPKVAVDDLITRTATISEVNRDQRRISLVDDSGRTITVYADPALGSLSRLERGDRVAVSYYQSLASGVVRPGDPPLRTTAIAETSRGRLGGAPIGTLGTNATMTARVEMIDAATNTFTVRGPAGNTMAFASQRPEFAQYLSTLTPGDTVQLAYTEGVAVALQRR